MALEYQPRDLVPESPATALSTVTVLDNWAPLGKGNKLLDFAFWNDDPTDTVTFIVAAGGKSGGPPANTYQWSITLAPGEHDIISVPNKQMAELVAEFWMTTAQKNAAGTAAVRRKITGVWRQ